MGLLYYRSVRGLREFSLAAFNGTIAQVEWKEMPDFIAEVSCQKIQIQLSTHYWIEANPFWATLEKRTPYVCFQY